MGSNPNPNHVLDDEVLGVLSDRDHAALVVRLARVGVTVEIRVGSELALALVVRLVRVRITVGARVGAELALG